MLGSEFKEWIYSIKKSTGNPIKKIAKSSSIGISSMWYLFKQETNVDQKYINLVLGAGYPMYERTVKSTGPDNELLRNMLELILANQVEFAKARQQLESANEELQKNNESQTSIIKTLQKNNATFIKRITDLEAQVKKLSGKK